MSEPAARARYHHGNLRSALVDAALALAREGGPDAVVLREASRRAGVSHNAAYRHFADRDSLLRTVSGRCMAELAGLMEKRIAQAGAEAGDLDTARARLRACGGAYLEFAESEPGWFRTAFAVPPGLGYFDAGEGVGERGLGPLELVTEQLDALDAAGGIGPGRREHAELSAWSAVHGLSTLLLDGPLRELPERERAQAREHLLETIQRGLEG